MNKALSIEELKELKRELTKHINNLDDFIVDAYYKSYNKFVKLIEELNNKKLSTLTIKEIKAINFINRLNKFDLEYMIKEL